MTQQPIKRRNPFERVVEEKPEVKVPTAAPEVEDAVEDDAFVEDEPVLLSLFANKLLQDNKEPLRDSSIMCLKRLDAKSTLQQWKLV